MQLNETNIVSQFEEEIKFAVPGDNLCHAVVTLCTHKEKGI